jgi:NAD(P)-dependent dehydrogenase (short-subunit alcohol dehydrogenase family)
MVVGARQGSLGAEIAEVFRGEGHRVTTAGVSGEESVKMELLRRSDVVAALWAVRPAILVCTAGVNRPSQINLDTTDMFGTALIHSLTINAAGPLLLLSDFIRLCKEQGSRRQFIAVSSNSAHVARSNSGPYCVSKAALSMGIRVAARECKGRPVIWAVEPGYLADTPMSQETAETWQHDALHRIPGLGGREGLSKREVAEHIVGMAMRANSTTHSVLNGATIRLDGGEQ